MCTFLRGDSQGKALFWGWRRKQEYNITIYLEQLIVHMRTGLSEFRTVGVCDGGCEMSNSLATEKLLLNRISVSQVT